MKELIQSGRIEEVQGAQNAAYLLNDERMFLLTEYKILKNQTKDGFAPCAKLLFNGKIKLHYFTSEYKSLQSIMTVLDGDAFLTVMANLLHVLLELENNGFLNCRNLDLSWDKIFVDTGTLTVNLIYLPLNTPPLDRASFENDIRTQMIRIIASLQSLKPERANRICTQLASGNISFHELYKCFCEECKGNGRGIKNIQPELVFSSVNAPKQVKLRIHQPEYIIGKNTAAVNGAVTFNKAISRVHCKFIYQSGNYYIVDLNSANGTFVNGERISPQEQRPVKNGDVVRLANSDFMICI